MSKKKLLTELSAKMEQGIKSMAVLIDPDKIKDDQELLKLIHAAVENKVDYFFVGGSLLTNHHLHAIVRVIKSNSSIPVVLFPGSNIQLDFQADAILFLSLISGRNPDLLIGQHVVAAPLIKNANLEVWPTGYMLIESGKSTTVSYMSNTTPIPADKPVVAACTAMAGEMLGLQLMYMDAGSGAENPISEIVIRKVKESISCPLIIGGGLNTMDKAAKALDAGADLIVIGNGIEEKPQLMTEIANMVIRKNKLKSVSI